VKVIYVEWEDACTTRGWVDLEHEFTTMAIQTVGYLINETDKSLTVGHSTSEYNTADPITIPKGWIKKRKYIKVS